MVDMKAMDRNELILKKLKASDLTPGTTEQIRALFEQLNASITQREVGEIVTTAETIFLTCWHNDTMVGMALMATYKVISGYKGMIEDVVVNEQYRGKGIGKRLMQGLLQEARSMQLSEILLFTGHHRKVAISLYTSLGFTLKESGLYRLALD